MKKIIFNLIVIFFVIIIFFVVYLSTIGIKTSRWNNQIDLLAKKLNKELKTEFKEIKIVLDPFNFDLNVKTIGPKLKLDNKIIELADIKSKISINSLINNNFSIKNLDISTKSLEIKNLISFIRNFQNSPGLYFLEKAFKKGYLISNINMEFNNQGKIKDNFKIRGFLKDADINFLKKYEFDNINLIFDIKHGSYKIDDIAFNLNDISLFSQNIIIKDINDSFFVKGSIENKDVNFDSKIINKFIKENIPKFNLKNLDLNSKSEFSFNLNKKLKLDNFDLYSKVKVNNLKLSSDFKLEKIFPNSDNEINLKNHLIDISYRKNKLFIKGKGNILLQKKDDKIDYQIKKQDENLDFEMHFTIDKNPFLLNLLKYKKKENSRADIIFKGSHTFKKKTKIKSFSFNENKNKMNIENLVFDENFKIDNFDIIDLEYFDEDLRENKIKIKRTKEFYSVTGPKFNANSLIESLINSDENDKNFKVLNSDLDLKFEIGQVFLDKENIVTNVLGDLSIQKDQIFSAKLDGFFSKNKKIQFTVNTSQNEKVTTLYMDRAEPIVNRYKFIKGFKNGILDFYSQKKGDQTTSNLKIYNFSLKELPILTKLLTLASLQGIADILSGEGITFDELEMNFRNQKNLITIEEMYAIGPAISILLDGYVEKNKLVSLRGSLVPATTINKAIGNIPVLGKILVGSKTGEGVFGVSFKIKGPPNNLETTVNPIKTLTPRFITRTLEKIKKLD